VTLSARPEPGTPAFQQALMSALQTRLGATYGPPQIRTMQRASRNTVVYRGLLGATPIVAKAQLTKPASVAVAEYHMLRALEHTSLGPAVRALRPVAVLEELGVLVTEEELGEHVRTVIEAACRRPEAGWNRAVAAVSLAAGALRSFHNAYASPADDRSGPSARVRCYLDFSPKNLLIRGCESSGMEMILMDPPEEEKWGSRCEDIGGFCFDMSRIRFMPGNLGSRAVAERVDRLKACFIEQYFDTLDVVALTAQLPGIAAAEHRRATQALGWYLRPWRYPSVLRETLRLCYLGPLTALYRAAGLRASYRNVDGLLRGTGQRASAVNDAGGP
jgi:hypothetical protein